MNVNKIVIYKHPDLWIYHTRHMMNSHKNRQCQYLVEAPLAVMVALHLFCFLHASDDFLDLARWNGVPFNDEHIFQCLPRVEWMTILSNSSV
jgi:hypothetical protein